MENPDTDAFTGSTFDDFLREEGLHREAESAAIQRVLAWRAEHTPLSESLDDGCAPSQEKDCHARQLADIAKKV